MKLRGWQKYYDEWRKRVTQKGLVFLCIVLNIFLSHSSIAAVYQWSVPVNSIVSPETNDHPTAFLWIPEHCIQVKSVVFSQQNMCEETIFDHIAFRETMAELDFAIVWITPGIDQQWDVRNGCQEAFDTMMDDFANVSGYSELKDVPIVPLGHSAMATFPWNFAAWNPHRTLAVISYKGDAPRTNLTGYGRENLEWGRNRNIDGIPGLMIEGEYEWWEARVNPALAFRMMYPKSCISFLHDTGQGHFDVSDKIIDYICLFLKKAADYRLPKNQNLNNPVQLVNLNPKDGWLGERWQVYKTKREKPNQFSNYKGDKHDAFWYFDEEMAEATEAHYKGRRNRRMQYIGYKYNGEWLPFNPKHHAQYLVEGISTDDLSFQLKAVFVDSSRMEKSFVQIDGKPSITKICGPVEKLNDSTFAVRFDRTGMNNTKRTGDIWLLASHPGNKKYKSAVQQFNLRIPRRNIEGKEQEITFLPQDSIINLPDLNNNELELNASSTSGLPVSYYVKDGPALIVGNKLKIASVPPSARFPVKITVVAWQYGSVKNPQIQSAESVEQSFFLTKNNIEN